MAQHNHIKYILIVILSFIGLYSRATTYYVSNTGSDAAVGTSTTTAWQTLTKVNTHAFSSGDSVLFQCGGTFYGNIRNTVTQSGVVFSSYGVGVKPIISGFTTISGWTSVGSGVWSASCTAADTNINLVTVNGSPVPMGRYPNTGYFSYTENSSTQIVSSATLSGAYTGAQVVLKANNYSLIKGPITSQSGNTLNFTNSSGITPITGFGFFIQKSLALLDTTNEWYYSGTSHTIYMYGGSSSPTGVQVATIDTLVIDEQNNNAFIGLSFQGANVDAFYLYNMSNPVITNCNIINTGQDGIVFNSPVTNAVVTGDSIINSLDNAVNCYYHAAPGLNLSNNYVYNTGMIPGAGVTYSGIIPAGANILVSGNTVRKSGYNGIFFGGVPATISKNIVDSFTMILDDGGGIYTGGNEGGVKTVDSNIVINGIGSFIGTPDVAAIYSVGIYGDENIYGWRVFGNTIINCSRSGVYVHDGAHNSILSNTIYNCFIQIELLNDNSGDSSLRADTVKNNIMFNKDSLTLSPQFCLSIGSQNNDINLTGVIDSNIYSSPLDTNGIIRTIYGGTTYPYGFSSWKSSYTGFDQHSSISPLHITPYTITAISGTSLFTNSTFTSNINGVSADFTPSTGSGFNWVSNGPIAGGTNYKDSVTGPSYTNVYFTIPNPVAGQQYLITLVGHSTNATTILMRHLTSSYVAYGLTKYFSIGSTNTHYSYVFTEPTSASSIYLVATIANQSGNKFFDSLYYVPIAAAITHPSDSITFKYNSSSSKIVNYFSSIYEDSKGRHYYGNVGLDPYRSTIFLQTSPTPLSLIYNISSMQQVNSPQ
jgi:parallel beta-helix repeat protein